MSEQPIKTYEENDTDYESDISNISEGYITDFESDLDPDILDSGTESDTDKTDIQDIDIPVEEDYEIYTDSCDSEDEYSINYPTKSLLFLHI